jgi:general secretion pathway protein G
MNLRPSLLDDLGAVSAVRWFCREFNEIYRPICIHTDLAVTDSAVPAELATPIFRTVQESLNNVARHAQASNVFVSMRTDRTQLTLEISDDGVGFDPQNTRRATLTGGHGLSGLRERAAKTGGTFSLQSRQGCGTVVRVGWPLASQPPRAQRQYGFTLLELLVVMVIIGLLAGFVAPRYFAQVGKSQVKAARAQIDAFDKSLDQYRLDMGRFPTTEEGLNGLVVAPPGEQEWGGPYLKKAVPPDPWGRPYVYVSPGEHGDVDIISYGKDGQPGGTGENADITNW